MVENRLLDAAKSMISQLNDQNARDQCEASVIESQRRLEFLEGELKALQLGTQSVSSAFSNNSNATSMSAGGSQPSPPPATSPMIPPRSKSMEAMSTTNFDLLKYASAITSDKVRFRLKEVRHKLDTEKRVKGGTDNLLMALARTQSNDQKKISDLKEQLSDSQFRITALTKAEHRYSALYVATGEEDDTLMGPFSTNLSIDVRVKVTGRLKIRLIGATNLPGRASTQSEVYAVLRIDGQNKATTRAKTQRWDESFDLPLEKAVECEFSVYSKQSNVLSALCWFKMSDLLDDLKAKHGSKVPQNLNESEEIWLDMEPAGQLLLRVTFASGTGNAVDQAGLIRREAVQKAYPRNGHKFFAYNAFQMIQCAVCNEFLSGAQAYRCQSCLYTIHAKCYTDVITKCITLNEIRAAPPSMDINTGQLLKFKIPHRFEQKLNLGANWCMHCGTLMTPGQKIHRCSECNKCAHRECSPMAPYFCGLGPSDAKILVEAFKKHEEDMHRRELEEAERARKEMEENPPPPQFAPSSGNYQQMQISQQMVHSPATTMLSSGASVMSNPQANYTQYASPLPMSQNNTVNTVNADLSYPPWAQPPPTDTHQMVSSPVAASTIGSMRPPRHDSTAAVIPPYLQQPAPQQQQQQQQQPAYQAPPYVPAPPAEEARLGPDDSKAIEESRIAEEIRQLQLMAARKEQERAEKARIIKQQKEREMQIMEEQRLLRERQEKERAEKEKQMRASAVSKQHMNIPVSVHKNITLNDFHFLAVLGRGAFGKVMLAQEKATSKHYAIKALKKEFIIKNDDVKSAKLERRIFQAASAAQHPFMVNLHSCFQTPERVYFVMEYVSGGDLMCHIQEKKRFSQNRAKFYACEVLLAIEYFHKNNIIYRDLKLDNILMCPDGHLKVADYGICKENMPYGATTRTYCGTPDYMAPEILSENKYGRAVDWWSFGVLIYVMLVGRYPFPGGDERDILDLILSDAIEYPSNMPKDTLSLLHGLLNKDPARRLGGGKLDAEEVKRHAYFAGVDWNAFMQKRVAPPWKPTISSATDVSNFDSEFTKEPPVLTPISSVLTAANQKEFDDFDYTADWAGR
ncbi:Serine/threonine kinase [Dinochytrium kinnereticum]|nr:Serine/threonine kinase [Dinochytrium kinnereticum]